MISLFIVMAIKFKFCFTKKNFVLLKKCPAGRTFSCFFHQSFLRMFSFQFLWPFVSLTLTSLIGHWSFSHCHKIEIWVKEMVEKFSLVI